MVDKVKANGFKMITTTEAPGREVKDDIAGPLQPGGASIAFALGPDDVKVEFVESRSSRRFRSRCTTCHFFNPKNTEMQAWYVKTFGAKPRDGGAFPAGGSAGRGAQLLAVGRSGRRHAGRALDHIGFEVKNLEAFCKKLEADGIKLARAVSAGAGAEHRHRLHHRSMGHLHRAHGRARQDFVAGMW